MAIRLFEPMRVLIVDDEEKYQHLGASIVKECVPESQIEYASDYESALPLLLRHYFDFVLLDLVLHKEAGPLESWEGPWLMQHLMESGLNQYIPVIIFTKF